MEQILFPSSVTGEITHCDRLMNNPGHPDIFIKLYTAALDSGFLAALPDRGWKTLCVIALHMDATGQCYPSRDAMARALGVNPSTASATSGPFPAASENAPEGDVSPSPPVEIRRQGSERTGDHDLWGQPTRQDLIEGGALRKGSFRE